MPRRLSPARGSVGHSGHTHLEEWCQGTAGGWLKCHTFSGHVLSRGPVPQGLPCPPALRHTQGVVIPASHAGELTVRGDFVFGPGALGRNAGGHGPVSSQAKAHE